MDRKVFPEYEAKGKKIVLCQPVWDDLKAFMDIMNEFHQESFKQHLWIPTAEMSLAQACDRLAGIMKKIELGNTIYLLAKVDGELAGMAWINVNNSEGMFGAGYGTFGIQLSDKFRGMGIGGKMMSILEQEAKNCGVKGVLLTVIHDNPARELYERVGYREIGRKPNFVASNFGKQSFEERADLVEMLKMF